MPGLINTKDIEGRLKEKDRRKDKMEKKSSRQKHMMLPDLRQTTMDLFKNWTFCIYEMKEIVLPFFNSYLNRKKCDENTDKENCSHDVDTQPDLILSSENEDINARKPSVVHLKFPEC